MSAIRRAANPSRLQIAHHVIARAFCSKFGITNCSLSDTCERSLQMGGHVSCGHSVIYFLGVRNLCLQSRTSNSNGEAADGFLDVDELPVCDKVDRLTDDEDDEEYAGEEGISRDEAEVSKTEAANSSLGSSETEKDLYHSEVRGKNHTIPLFKVIMEAPWQSVSSVLNKWVEGGNHLGRDEVMTALRSLRRRRLYGKALQFVEWLEINKRLNFVERDYACHLDLIAKVHGLQKAEKYIDRVPESFRSEVIYEALLANCVSTSNYKKAEEVFKKITDLALPISIFSCNQLLLLYKRFSRSKIADLLLMMEKENIKPSLFTYKLLIDTKARANDITGMEQIMEAMKTDGVEPDLVTRAMVANHYVVGGLNGKAEATLKEMEGEDVIENRKACKLLLPLYAMLGKADEVERIWKWCESDPSLDECLAAIEAWGKLGRVEDAESVFESMLRTWKKLSSKHYNSLLNVYANHKLLSKGKELAKRMSDSGCRIGPSTWDALIKLYVKAGELEKADSILQKVAQQNQVRPLYSSYITLLDQYAKRGDIYNSEKIFHRLKQIEYSGRMQQYQLLLEAYVNAKFPAYGFRERMKADNMFPSKQILAQLAALDAFKKTHISELD
ncbi:pentatricopeptide repeat-containing protein At1g80270, mitochondrial-like [Typha angustifolia]|uniref:pentatricopeptide repeat-containing protein At1g80270, mitochondrial-like n=1 Tax=Typha angustifolia TaxID=59011 RepID=UPI003C2F3D58